jgi:hypothetical protein
MEYVQVATAFSRKRRLRVRRVAGVLLIGIACLFSRYTILLSVQILVVSGFAMLVPHLFKGTATNEFRESNYLRDEMTYGVSERGLWVRDPNHSGWASWKMLGAWRIRGDWLALGCSGITSVFLPVSELQAAGIFEQVMARVRTHGTAYDGEAAEFAQATAAAAAA